jgi:hypothetical protein
MYKYKLVSEALTDPDAKAELRGDQQERAHRFAKAVCKHLSAKMCLKNSWSYWIYRDDCPYCLGWVAYGDFRYTGSTDNMYVVCSHNITNGKYNESAQQYYMKMSTNINTAVRNAKKFLRIMSPQEIAGIRLNRAQTAVQGVVTDAREEFIDIRNRIIDVETSLYSARMSRDSVLMTELRHLMNSNHKFIDPTFGENLTTFFAKWDELDTLQNRTVPMWFVRVYERTGQQMFDVVTIDNAEDSWKAKIGDVLRYTTDDLPEDIMQKLSVLNILEKDDYVDGVGFSAGEGMFYVVR